MANLSLKKNEMPSLDPQIRKTNFEEVALGYNEQLAIDEAERCLNCANPKCVLGCPVNIQIPSFINEIKKGDFEKAYQVITQDSFLPAICGRVCPQESQCEKLCVRAIKGEPVGIGRLERFVADYHKEENDISTIHRNGHKIAIVGSGPAGLTCAGLLASKGYEVSVFEALHVSGGVLVYGIPEFRLPKKLVQDEIEKLSKMGVTFINNVVIGKTITVDELLEEYEAVFIGTGAGLPKFMKIKGENYNGVYSANEFLTRVNLMKAYQKDSATPIKEIKKAVVVGGGNVAMDAARTALRLGAKEVAIVYRRSMKELPAREEEIEHAKEEGIVFKLLNNPIEVLADDNGNVKGIRCIKMELGEPDESGRRRPIEVKGSEFVEDCDALIMAIGNSPNPLIRSTTSELNTEKWGGIIVDEFGRTSKKGVYAGGDAVTGAATVILAMGAGKLAAQAIDEDIQSK